MKKHLLITGFLALGIALVGILLLPGNSTRNAKSSASAKAKAESVSESQSSRRRAAVASEAGASLQPLPDRAMTKEEILVLLNQVAEILRGGDPEAIKRALAQLDEVFAGSHHDAAAGIAAILDFLKTGQDAATGEGFLVGAGGILTEATTLRVFLMDQLGTLSRESGSAAALEVARGSLSRMDSADEWAISMRNVAWFDPNSREFLAARVTAMLDYEPWRQNPTQGMLEAFDLIVHTGALNTLPDLIRMLSGEESPLGRAASVAMDRLAATRPLELTTMLNHQPDLLGATPLQRADLFAHVDLNNPAQRQQAEDYLARPDISAAEREKFLAALLQNGQFVSHNLVTPFTPPENLDHAGARLDVLSATLNSWISDERFTGFRTELSQLGATVNQIDDEINADTATQ